jgi:tetratricopeptide (TPR) repeat protein
MADPKRLDLSPVSDAADRDGQAEALLVEGLDHYFAGRFEQAIHLWTRVLFLDRSHARARAYIDRARLALSERQRQAEEMLQASRELIEQGRTEAARHLLSEVVAAGGDEERAEVLRVHLERVERIRLPPYPGAAQTAAAPGDVPGWSWPRRSRHVTSLVALGATVVLIVVAATSPAVRDLIGLGGERSEITTVSSVASLPILSSSEVALVRARTLYSRGRLAEALQALERVSSESSVRAAADTLRVEIQQLLLASSRDGSVASRPAVPVKR